MNKKILFILLIGIVIIGSSFLILVNSIKNQTYESNGFIRNFELKPITLKKQVNLPSRIARVSTHNSNLYFFDGSFRSIYRYNSKIDQLDTISFPFSLNRRVLKNFQLVVDSPDIRVYAGNLGTVYNFKESDTNWISKKLEVPLFTQIVELTSGNLIVKGFNNLRERQYLQKIDFDKGAITDSADVFGPQTDGGFSKGGDLLYDDELQNIIYLHSYENKFICLDTNLNTKYIGRTIDTTFINPVETKSFMSENGYGSLMPSVPLKRVNAFSCVRNGKLYVVSSLKADNESNNDFKNNVSVDTYDVESGKYLSTFYIPNLKLESLRYLSIINNKIIAVTRNIIFSYTLMNEIP